MVQLSYTWDLRAINIKRVPRMGSKLLEILTSWGVIIKTTWEGRTEKDETHLLWWGGCMGIRGWWTCGWDKVAHSHPAMRWMHGGQRTVHLWLSWGRMPTACQDMIKIIRIFINLGFSCHNLSPADIYFAWLVGSSWHCYAYPYMIESSAHPLEFMTIRYKEVALVVCWYTNLAVSLCTDSEIVNLTLLNWGQHFSTK